MTWTCLRLELNGLSHISGETPLIWHIKICLHSCICPLSLWSFPKFDDISQIMSSGSHWPGLKNDTLKWRETWPMKSARSSFFLDTAQLQVSSAVRAPCLPVCSGSESGTFWCLGSLNRTAGVTTSQTMMSTVTETGTQMNDCTANKSQISLRTFLVCLNGQIKGYWDYIRWGYNKNYWHQCQLSAIN